MNTNQETESSLAETIKSSGKFVNNFVLYNAKTDFVNHFYNEISVKMKPAIAELSSSLYNYDISNLHLSKIMRQCAHCADKTTRNGFKTPEDFFEYALKERIALLFDGNISNKNFDDENMLENVIDNFGGLVMAEASKIYEQMYKMHEKNISSDYLY